MATYLVTGASSGIGEGLVRALVARGDRVWGLARRLDRLSELATVLGPERFGFFRCDVARQDEVDAVKGALDHEGIRPDVVILNAGINPERLGGDFSIREFEQVVRVNLLGALTWVDFFLPRFRLAGRGQFVGISSLAAFRGDGRWVGYCASKAALTRAFEALRGRHAAEGVTFTTIHLGAVVTGMGVESRSFFRLERDEAVRRILRAADRRVDSITIPRPLRLAVELMRLIPDRHFSRMVGATFGTAPQRRRSNAGSVELQ